jgi:hypothetical protein
MLQVGRSSENEGWYNQNRLAGICQAARDSPGRAMKVTHLTRQLANLHVFRAHKASLLPSPFAELNRRKPGHLGSLESPPFRPFADPFLVFWAVVFGSAHHMAHTRVDCALSAGLPSQLRYSFQQSD